MSEVSDGNRVVPWWLVTGDVSFGWGMFTDEGDRALSTAVLAALDGVTDRAEALVKVRAAVEEVGRTYSEVHDTEPEDTVTDAVYWHGLPLEWAPVSRWELFPLPEFPTETE